MNILLKDIAQRTESSGVDSNSGMFHPPDHEPVEGVKLRLIDSEVASIFVPECASAFNSVRVKEKNSLSSAMISRRRVGLKKPCT